MCSPCGPMVCYKYEDCGPPLRCLPKSAFKRNGLQDCQYFQQGSIRYLCRAGPCCSQPCPPPCPPCVRRPPPGKTYKGNTANAVSRAEEGGAQKKDDSENQLKRTKSRELRGGIMYYSCHCIKRNGLQHDCRRTGCGGEPSCLVLPDPVCAPSQLARARGLADPAPFAKHMAAANGGASGGVSDAATSGGKRFIVCELKGIIPGHAPGSENTGKCCKCPNTIQAPRKVQNFNPNTNQSVCPCKGVSNTDRSPLDKQFLFLFDEKTLQSMIKSFESKEIAPSGVTLGPGGRARKTSKPEVKEPCTRPGCVHAKPPSPCVWDAPCKADCFETPAGIQPGRNPLTGGGFSPAKSNAGNMNDAGMSSKKIKLLMPECCTGCSGPGEGGTSSGGPAGGLPVIMMKLC